ncbi:mitochondrial 54S ribosomal protein bL34m NDAI_0J01340 [Naumovozyma dairenensis CBS 421]|uniref:Large ribosomal subunit protein bL34m n=1 Tax=Naumovozyma dairenensis (strain ATCC 10597 / BCRC 20456 / CBS 421 / NBRC 0211 / NRRL Y-12639) TaxID=1071378 RepID=G0WGU8_NAUDC|nr:hypothetical protein NDAI_0J01340 [Naumovozyma dairenensis CBS 421]CCD27026.1 hypothetical protein NDAI_0J01340 [Naumovozyma dairenensis CBS 421]
MSLSILQKIGRYSKACSLLSLRSMANQSFNNIGLRSFSSFSSTTTSTISSLINQSYMTNTFSSGLTTTPLASSSSSSSSLILPSTSPFMINQKRWKSRGNTYQPSTLKRKRKYGFLSRMRDRQASKILKRRKLKGRWFLSH